MWSGSHRGYGFEKMMNKSIGAAPRRAFAISSLLNFFGAVFIIRLNFLYFPFTLALVVATALAALIGWRKWDRVMGLAILAGVVGCAAVVLPLLWFIVNGDWGA